jgi:hypothetical protein
MTRSKSLTLIFAIIPPPKNPDGKTIPCFPVREKVNADALRFFAVFFSFFCKKLFGGRKNAFFSRKNKAG